MTQKRIDFRDQISRNKRKSVFLMFSVFVVLVLLGYVISLAFSPGYFFIIMSIAIIFSVGYILVSYYNSHKIAIASVKATRAYKDDYKQYHNLVEGLTLASGLPKPELYVMHSKQINAFASGRDPQHAVICVTEGALEKLDKNELEGVLAKTSHTPLVAGCMVKVKENFSYDKDPETGKITYYADDSGEVVLSKSGRNLTLGAQEALDAGLCDGIADTSEELAKLLDLEKWVEIDTYGVDIAEKWWATLETFEEEFPELQNQFNGDVTGKTERQRLNNQIKAGKDMLRWAKKLGETAEMLGLSEQNIDRIERGILDIKRQLQLIDD